MGFWERGYGGGGPDLHQKVRNGFSEVIVFEPRLKRCTGQLKNTRKSILVKRNSMCEGAERGRAWCVGGLKAVVRMYGM